MSSTIPYTTLIHRLTHKKALFTGLFIQSFMMPLLGFLSVIITSLFMTVPYGISMTLIIITSSPGGSYSNWFCSTFNTDLGLSIAMTMFSTLFSLLFLPMNLILYSWILLETTINNTMSQNILKIIQYDDIIITLFVVISSIVLAILCNAHIAKKIKKYANIMHLLAQVSGISLILLSILVSNHKITKESYYLLPIIIFPIFFGVTFSHMIGNCMSLQKQETMTISIECGYQNTAIGLTMAITMFEKSSVMVPIVYGTCQGLVIGLYCVIGWKMGWTRCSKNEKFVRMLTGNYQRENEISNDNNIDLKSLREYYKSKKKNNLCSRCKKDNSLLDLVGNQLEIFPKVMIKVNVQHEFSNRIRLISTNSTIESSVENRLSLKGGKNKNDVDDWSWNEVHSEKDFNVNTSKIKCHLGSVLDMLKYDRQA